MIVKTYSNKTINNDNNIIRVSSRVLIKLKRGQWYSVVDLNHILLINKRLSHSDKDNRPEDSISPDIYSSDIMKDKVEVAGPEGAASRSFAPVLVPKGPKVLSEKEICEAVARGIELPEKDKIDTVSLALFAKEHNYPLIYDYNLKDATGIYEGTPLHMFTKSIL